MKRDYDIFEYEHCTNRKVINKFQIKLKISETKIEFQNECKLQILFDLIEIGFPSDQRFASTP